MDFMKDLINTASTISKKTDYLVKIGECKMDIKHCEKEIEKRKLLLGSYIFEWYKDRNLNIRALPKLCKEILEYEKEIGKLKKQIDSLKKFAEE
jgi:hypothetical protein